MIIRMASSESSYILNSVTYPSAMFETAEAETLHVLEPSVQQVILDLVAAILCMAAL